METRFNWPNGQAPKETSHGTLIVLVLLLLVLLGGVAAYIYYSMHHTPADQAAMDEAVGASQDMSEGPAEAEPTNFTLEEREQRLQQLEANPDGLSDEERRLRLQSLDEDFANMPPVEPLSVEPVPVAEESEATPTNVTDLPSVPAGPNPNPEPEEALE
jgi:hypothetical protein